MDVSGPQFHAQRKTKPAFAGEDRGIRTLPAIFAVEADRHRLLVAENCESGCVRIDRGAVAESQALEEFGAQFVVSGLQTVETVFLKPPEKGPKRVAVRKSVQTQQQRNQAVVSERLSVLDAPNSGHQSEDMSHEQIHGAIVPVVIIRPADIRLQKAPKLE